MEPLPWLFLTDLNPPCIKKMQCDDADRIAMAILPLDRANR